NPIAEDDAHHVVATPLEGLGHRVPGAERDLALRRRTAHHNTHSNRFHACLLWGRRPLAASPHEGPVPVYESLTQKSCESSVGGGAINRGRARSGPHCSTSPARRREPSRSRQ